MCRFIIVYVYYCVLCALQGSEGKNELKCLRIEHTGGGLGLVKNSHGMEMDIYVDEKIEN